MFAMSLAELIAYLIFIPETKGKQMAEAMPGEKKKAVSANSPTKEEAEPLKRT